MLPVAAGYSSFINVLTMSAGAGGGIDCNWPAGARSVTGTAWILQVSFNPAQRLLG